MFLVASGFHGVAEHGGILRAGSNQSCYAAQLYRLPHTRFAGAFLNLAFLHPNPATARAATKSSISVTRHLDQFTAGRLDHPAWGVIHTVITAQIARIVIGDFVT